MVCWKQINCGSYNGHVIYVFLIPPVVTELTETIGQCVIVITFIKTIFTNDELFYWLKIFDHIMKLALNIMPGICNKQ